MLDFLAGVPGKLKTLVDRLTATRAAYLDNLSEGPVAQADTAVSNADYTAARAGYLDKLNITGNAASEATPILDVPITAGVVAPYTTTAASPYYSNIENVATSATGWTTAFSYTGQGVVEFVAHYLTTNASSYAAYCRIIIDGVTYWSSGSGSAPTAYTFSTPIGGAAIAFNGAGNSTWSPIPCGAVPFKSSLLIEHYVVNAAMTSRVVCRYRKTA